MQVHLELLSPLVQQQLGQAYSQLCEQACLLLVQKMSCYLPGSWTDSIPLLMRGRAEIGMDREEASSNLKL